MGNERKERRLEHKQGVSEARAERSCKELDGVGSSNGADFETLQPIEYKLWNESIKGPYFHHHHRYCWLMKEAVMSFCSSKFPTNSSTILVDPYFQIWPTLYFVLYWYYKHPPSFITFYLDIYNVRFVIWSIKSSSNPSNIYR